jgi:hypothetical protein
VEVGVRWKGKVYDPISGELYAYPPFPAPRNFPPSYAAEARTPGWYILDVQRWVDEEIYNVVARAHLPRIDRVEIENRVRYTLYRCGAVRLIGSKARWYLYAGVKPRRILVSEDQLFFLQREMAYEAHRIRYYDDATSGWMPDSDDEWEIREGPGPDDPFFELYPAIVGVNQTLKAPSKWCKLPDDVPPLLPNLPFLPTDALRPACDYPPTDDPPTDDPPTDDPPTDDPPTDDPPTDDPPTDDGSATSS